MKEISLTRGLSTTVDDEDFDLLNKYKWRADKKKHKFYAQRTHRFDNGTKKTIAIHVLILGTTWVDHIDGNPLNNQRSNLRMCTPKQNSMNTRSHFGSSSKYKGVSWVKKYKHWRSEIYFNGKTIYIGSFQNETDAAIAYDKMSTELFGEWGKPNFEYKQ